MAAAVQGCSAAEARNVHPRSRSDSTRAAPGLTKELSISVSFDALAPSVIVDDAPQGELARQLLQGSSTNSTARAVGLVPTIT